MSDPHNPALRPEAWTSLRDLTPARVALGRTGASLPTREILWFGHAHALARDAVHATLDGAALGEQLIAFKAEIVAVTSGAADRARYLRRPDLGRRLSPESRLALGSAHQTKIDLAIVVADGLSATGVQSNAAALIGELLPSLRDSNVQVGPIVLATQARVALGDEVGEVLGARMVLVLIGERPGLSSPDSLGAYLTFGPRVGLRDNQRNCVSNIRDAGLTPRRAAHAILWLVAEAFRRGETGVALKDGSVDIDRLAPTATAALP